MKRHEKQQKQWSYLYTCSPLYTFALFALPNYVRTEIIPNSRSYNHPTNASKTYCVRWSRSLSWRMSTSWRSTSTSTKGSSYNSSLKHSSQVNYIIHDIHMIARILNPMRRFCSRYADAYDRRDRSGRPEGSSGCCVKIRTLHPLQWTSHWRCAHRRQR